MRTQHRPESVIVSTELNMRESEIERERERDRERERREEKSKNEDFHETFVFFYLFAR